MLGHASAAMTLDTYGSLYDDDLEDLADRLEARWESSRGLEVRWESSRGTQGAQGGSPKDGTVRRQKKTPSRTWVSRVGPVGLEPTTNGLKARCSTN
jgi:hypothetical protein